MTTLEQDVYAILTNSNTPQYIKKILGELWARACSYEQALLQLRDIDLNFEEL